MASDTGTGVTPWLAFLIGGLIVAVVVLGFYMFTGGQLGGTSAPPQVTLNVKAPKTPSDRHWWHDRHDPHDRQDNHGHN